MTTTNRISAHHPEFRSLRAFTIEQVDRLIPTLAVRLERLWAYRRELAIELLESDPALAAMRRPAGGASRSLRVAELKERIVAAVAAIETCGCIVKDLDLGLLDFPSRRDGRLVYLCWKPGERSVRFWHGTDETFVDRKPL